MSKVVIFILALLALPSSATAATIHWTLDNFTAVNNPDSRLVGFIDIGPDWWSSPPPNYDISLKPYYPRASFTTYEWSTSNTVETGYERPLPGSPGAPFPLFYYGLSLFDPTAENPFILSFFSGDTLLLPDGSTSPLPLTATVCTTYDSSSCTYFSGNLSVTPLPSTVWLFASAIIALASLAKIARRRREPI